LARKKQTQSKTPRKTRQKSGTHEESHDDVSSAAQGPGAVRRTHEVFGILILAASLLVGPSLYSVQFGSGQMMGPFGQMVGGIINWGLGLGGYLLVMALLIMAIRIFAAALGHRPRSTTTLRRWRRRTGTTLGLVFGSVLLHLVARPLRIADASFGGVVGEYCGELLCGLVSTPGTWIVTLTALALAVVLATDFSWVGAWLRVWNTTAEKVSNTESTVERARTRLRLMSEWVSAQIAHPRVSIPDGSGAATLPPVVRIDLSEHLNEAEAERGRAIRRTVDPSLPNDLEIGQGGSGQGSSQPTIQPPVIHKPRGTSKAQKKPSTAPARRKALQEQPSDKVGSVASPSGKGTQSARQQSVASPSGKGTQSAMHGEALAAALDANPATGEKESINVAVGEQNKRRQKKKEEEGVTIVQPTFGEAEVEDEKSREKKLEDPKGDGFVLKDGVFRPPPVSLLKIHDDGNTKVDEEAIQAQAIRLTESLRNYKIEGQVTQVHPGPVVTMYEFIPAPGTRISKVASLSNDLAMSLHALRVRIVAPLPGRGSIGIEVPNEQREMVSFRDIIADKKFQKNKSAKLALALGKNISGGPVVMDLAKMPHLLVAGSTGSGKSVSINSMICSLLMRYSPEEVRLIMIDPKILELSGYNGIPHLLLPVVTDPKQANIALRWAVAEMERRYQLLANIGARDITSFNRSVDKKHADAESARQQELPLKSNDGLIEAEPTLIKKITKNVDGTEEVIEVAVEETNDEPVVVVARSEGSDEGKSNPDLKRMPYLVVIIDEFADLMMVASKEVENSVARLAQKARACGIHLILATQRPSVDVITGVIKANFPSRIAFQVASNHDSKTIIGCYGAENLLGAGDMLVLDRGADMKRLHGAYIDDDEIEGVIGWLKNQGRPIYDMEILKAPEEDDKGEDKSSEPTDALYDQAMALVAETQQASISMVQRRLRIGYNRAARMIEQMEADGIVGPPDGVRGRQVLIQHQE